MSPYYDGKVIALACRLFGIPMTDFFLTQQAAPAGTIVPVGAVGFCNYKDRHIRISPSRRMPTFLVECHACSPSNFYSSLFTRNRRTSSSNRIACGHFSVTLFHFSHTTEISCSYVVFALCGLFLILIP